MAKWYDKFLSRRTKAEQRSANKMKYTTSITSGSIYKMGDLKGDTSLSDIHTQIDVMRALAEDSQISTALSYYATDATTPNSSGQIIWATAKDPNSKEVADIVNELFRRWNVKAYARDHILELATVGNLYIPTTDLYKDEGDTRVNQGHAALEHNSIPDEQFDIVPAYNIQPEDVVHLWFRGKPVGFILQPETDAAGVQYRVYPESSIVHFSLGGLLGKYQIETSNNDGEIQTFDIQFAQPLMERAVQPTQTLNLLENALLLSSLVRVVKFINIDCGTTAEEDEIRDALQQIKDAIEQQLSINTSTGDAQSFVNPQSPNNLIYLPKVNGQDAISVTDLNMSEATETDNKLLQYYQDKKLSVLGVPKEAMNFSSAEGLGNAGTVMSQRSALYANALARLESAYISGWEDAINKYFVAKNMSGFVGKYELHMNPIVTEMSAIQFDKRDAAINQATQIVEMMKSIGIDDTKDLKIALSEILSDVLPKIGAAVNSWQVDLTTEEGGTGDAF